MPKLNLLGQKFGMLTVIEEHPKIKNRTAWLCKCECGNQKAVITKSLRNGNTKSCGCLHKKTVSKDLSNQRFGRLIALKPTEERVNGSVIWECQCDCGNICFVSQSCLSTGHTRSCGCLQKERVSEIMKIDITNQKFGKLTALYPLNDRCSSGGILWCCKCECGNYVDVSVASLKSGHTASCGCQKSKGEALIKRTLDDNNIKYIKEKTFQDCRFSDTNNMARFDFYLTDYNVIIEYDGIQHFQKIGFDTFERFEEIQKRDQEKNEYCKRKNIPLIRIPYTDFHKINIEYILERIENICTVDMLSK